MKALLRKGWIGLAALCFICATTQAQTTRPAPPAWGETARTFAQALIAGDVTNFTATLAPEAAIRPLDDQTSITPEALLQLITGATLVSTRVYSQTPTTFASDLAADFATAATVPAASRREMIPDQSTMIRANNTANRWIGDTLQPAKGEMIATLVLWPAPEANPSPALRPTNVRPIFVLLKGTADAGKYLITQVRFGDPLATR